MAFSFRLLILLYALIAGAECVHAMTCKSKPSIYFAEYKNGTFQDGFIVKYVASHGCAQRPIIQSPAPETSDIFHFYALQLGITLNTGIYKLTLPPMVKYFPIVPDEHLVHVKLEQLPQNPPVTLLKREWQAQEDQAFWQAQFFSWGIPLLALLLFGWLCLKPIRDLFRSRSNPIEIRRLCRRSLGWQITFLLAIILLLLGYPWFPAPGEYILVCTVAGTLITITTLASVWIYSIFKQNTGRS